MKKIVMATMVTGALLVGCGESDASASEGGSSWLGKSLEFDITAKPHFGQDILGNLEQDNQLAVLSKNDEQVKITDVIVNRGNCEVYDIGAEFDRYTMNEERFKEFFEKHPEYDFIKEGKKLPTKDGKTVGYNKWNDKTLDSHKPKGMEYYNNLAPEAQALYDKEHKDTRKVLGFGQEYSYSIECAYDNVLEVTIKTDKGEVSYKMGR